MNSQRLARYEQLLHAHQQPRIDEVAVAFLRDPDVTSCWCVWTLRAALIGQEHDGLMHDDLVRACAADSFDVAAAQCALVLSGLAHWDALMDEYIDASILHLGALSEIAEALARTAP